MANSLKNAAKELGAAGTAPETNMDAVHRVIDECAAGFRRITAERKELNEQAGDLRERLRDAGIDPKPFMAALRVADFEDQAARNEYMTAYQITYERLATGGQMDWVAAVANQAPDDGDMRPRFLKDRQDAAASGG